MAIVTAAQRTKKIADEQETIQKSWARIASDIQRETDLLKQFAAWKNDNFINNKGDLDIEDMDAIHNQFSELFSALSANMSILNDVGNLRDANIEVFKTNNDAFIASHNIDIHEFDKRYQN